MEDGSSFSWQYSGYRSLPTTRHTVHAHDGLRVRGILLDRRTVSAAVGHYSRGTRIAWIAEPCKTPDRSSVSVLITTGFGRTQSCVPFLLRALRMGRYSTGGDHCFLGVWGKKFPTISAGLKTVSMNLSIGPKATYMLCGSRRMVKEKQQWISGSLEPKLGFFNEQLVNMAFCVLSKAMAPNFSQ